MASSAFKARFQDKLFTVPKDGMLKVTERNKISKNSISESKCFTYQSGFGSQSDYQSTSPSPIKKTKSLISIPSDFSENYEVSSVSYSQRPNRNLNRVKLLPIVRDLSESNSRSQLGSYFNPRNKPDTKSFKLEAIEPAFKGMIRRKLSYSTIQSAKLESLKLSKP
jgi:hypothetical protein